MNGLGDHNGVGMTKATDDLVLSTLMEIKGDIGSIQSDMRQVKESLSKSNIEYKELQEQIDTLSVLPAQFQGLRDMEGRVCSQIVRLDKDITGRIEKLENEVKVIKETDLPGIKSQLVISQWLSTNKSKAITMIIVALLGAAGNILTGFVKDNMHISYTGTGVVASGPPKPTTTAVIPDVVSPTDTDYKP